MVTLHYPELAERAQRQRELLPELYGEIDLAEHPYRLTTDPRDKSALPAWVAERGPILEDKRVVELITTATMLGDVAADPYASLVDEHGVRGLIDMLQRACHDGLEAVPDAPDELRSFIEAMEATPAWLDMGLVEEGARRSRISAAFVSPFITRGAFLGTFLNTYAALPMALTGALSGRRAARRVNETTSFFAVTTLPGALERHGPGFEAAAMVRLMHSMVRYHALKHPERWDRGTYGIPVPLVDQMPAGLINMYLLATLAVRRHRSEFTPDQRAMLEFSRYRCFLLGLPEELLPTTPGGILQLFHARAALLRDDFDDSTCGELVRSTMAAYLRQGHTWFDRAADTVEKSWSKVFFLAFCGGDRQAAAAMSVTFSPGDVARIAATGPFLLGRFLTVLAAADRPLLRRACDTYTTRVLHRRLAAYGKPEYATDASTYRPAGSRVTPS